MNLIFFTALTLASQEEMDSQLVQETDISTKEPSSQYSSTKQRETNPEARTTKSRPTSTAKSNRNASESATTQNLPMFTGRIPGSYNPSVSEYGQSNELGTSSNKQSEVYTYRNEPTASNFQPSIGSDVIDGLITTTPKDELESVTGDVNKPTTSSRTAAQTTQGMTTNRTTTSISEESKVTEAFASEATQAIGKSPTMQISTPANENTSRTINKIDSYLNSDSSIGLAVGQDNQKNEYSSAPAAAPMRRGEALKPSNESAKEASNVIRVIMLPTTSPYAKTDAFKDSDLGTFAKTESSYEEKTAEKTTASMTVTEPAPGTPSAEANLSEPYSYTNNQAIGREDVAPETAENQDRFAQTQENTAGEDTGKESSYQASPGTQNGSLFAREQGNNVSVEMNETVFPTMPTATTKASAVTIAPTGRTTVIATSKVVSESTTINSKNISEVDVVNPITGSVILTERVSYADINKDPDVWDIDDNTQENTTIAGTESPSSNGTNRAETMEGTTQAEPTIGQFSPSAAMTSTNSVKRNDVGATTTKSQNAALLTTRSQYNAETLAYNTEDQSLTQQAIPPSQRSTSHSPMKNTQYLASDKKEQQTDGQEFEFAGGNNSPFAPKTETVNQGPDEVRYSYWPDQETADANVEEQNDNLGESEVEQVEPSLEVSNLKTPAQYESENEQTRVVRTLPSTVVPPLTSQLKENQATTDVRQPKTGTLPTTKAKKQDLNMEPLTGDMMTLNNKLGIEQVESGDYLDSPQETAQQHQFTPRIPQMVTSNNNSTSENKLHKLFNELVDLDVNNNQSTDAEGNTTSKADSEVNQPPRDDEAIKQESDSNEKQKEADQQDTSKEGTTNNSKSLDQTSESRNQETESPLQIAKSIDEENLLNSSSADVTEQPNNLTLEQDKTITGTQRDEIEGGDSREKNTDDDEFQVIRTDEDNDDPGLVRLLLHPENLPPQTVAEDIADVDSDYVLANNVVIHDDIDR